MQRYRSRLCATIKSGRARKYTARHQKVTGESHVTKRYQKHESIVRRGLPPYSPDLSPSDYAIFGLLKRLCRPNDSPRTTTSSSMCGTGSQRSPGNFTRQPFTGLYRSGTSASTARPNTSDIQVLVSVPRPPAHFFLNAPHKLENYSQLHCRTSKYVYGDDGKRIFKLKKKKKKKYQNSLTYVVMGKIFRFPLRG